MAIELITDKAAADQQTKALDLALHGRFDEAHSGFAEARRMVRGSTVLVGNIPSLSLQLAQVNRDDAFTITRRAIGGRDHHLLEDSYHKLEGCVLEATSIATQHGEAAFTPKAWSYLASEIGATMDIGDRIAVVNEIPFERAVSVIPAPNYTDMNDPNHAWYYELRGSNRYYPANRAMKAARYERIKGNDLVGRWIAMAYEQLHKAEEDDPANVTAIKRTIQAGRLPLAFKWLARRSVSKRP